MSSVTGPRILMAGVTAAVVAAVVAAVFVLGSPAEQRQRRLDERRVRDLSTIENSIRAYASTHPDLPSDLAALGREPGPRRAPTDPETGAAYEYSLTGKEAYRLCAVFAGPSAEAASAYAEREGWTHGAGRQCFERKQKIGS